MASSSYEVGQIAAAVSSSSASSKELAGMTSLFSRAAKPLDKKALLASAVFPKVDKKMPEAAEKKKAKRKDEERRDKEAPIAVATAALVKEVEGGAVIQKKKRKRVEAPEKEVEKPIQEEPEVTATSSVAVESVERVDEKSDRTIFVGNLPKSTKRKAIARFFGQWGQVESARIRSLPTDGVKIDQHGNQALVKKVSAQMGKLTDAKLVANAYVVYSTVEEATKAVNEANGLVWPDSDRHIRVDSLTKSRSKEDHLRTAFVGNLPRSADEESLRSHFADHLGGHETIVNVRIVRDRETHTAIGVAYVLLSDKALLAAALELDGSVYGSRPLRVKTCGKRTKRDNKNQSLSNNKRKTSAPLSGAARRIEKKQKSSPGERGEDVPSWMGRRATEGEGAKSPRKKDGKKKKKKRSSK